MTKARATIRRTLGLLTPLAIACAPAVPVMAQESAAPVKSFFEQVPAELEGVDIIEHVDDKLPLDLTFTNEAGKVVKLGDYFTGDKPVILTLNYYRCPMLCTYALNGMVDALKKIDWSIGDEFRILTFTINPDETAELARVKKEAYLVPYNRPEAPAAEGWSFHVGAQESITALTKAVGFGYKLQPDGEYAHAAVLILCTPDGRISRYVYGIQPKVSDLRLALIEAGDGKVGSAFERFILWCHRYDPSSKGYVKSAMRIMQLGGMLTMLTLGTGLLMLWRTDAMRSMRQRAAGESPTVSEGGTTT